MRMLAWMVMPLSIVATVLPVWLALGGSHAALGQETQTTKPTKRQASEALGVGAKIVVKNSSIALDDDGRQVPSWSEKTFWIERIDGDRVQVVSRDKRKRGWVRRDQVVPVSQAIDFFTAEIAKDPKNTDPLWKRAQLWVEPQDDDRALADYDQVIRLAPKHSASYVARSRIYLRHDRIDQALADCNKAIMLDSKDAAAYRERSVIWRTMQDQGRAHADLDEAIRLQPTDVNGWILRSFSWRSENNPAEELKDLNEAIRLAPTSSAALVSRGALWVRRTDYDKAMADYDEAIKLDPKDAYAYFCRGQAWAMKRYHDKAILDYSEAIKLDPKIAYYRKNRADAWSARGMHDQAVADYDEAIRLDPTDVSAYVARGNEWLKESIASRTAPDKAIADFSRAIELEPNYAPAYFYRAESWRRKREYAKMARDLSTWTQVDDQNPQSHESLARLLATCKDAAIRDGKRAFAEATRACELSKWKDPVCLDALAAANAETGDFPAAVKWENQAIKLQMAEVFYDTDECCKMQDHLYLYRHNEPCRE